MSSIPLKRCSKCGGRYPATSEFFWKNRTDKSGLQAYCINCASKKPRKYDFQLPLPTEPNSALIMLTKGKTTIIDTEDADLCSLKWYAYHNDGLYYAVHSFEIGDGKRKHIGLHRIILSRIIGRDLKANELPDHIDRDTLNNRRSNLRVASSSQNQANKKRKKNSKSGFKGVYYHKRDKKWIVQVKKGGVYVYTGRFDTPEEAHEAYKREAKRAHGEFARFE